jgi:hypothetical protein
MSHAKPPLELSVEVETADGAHYTWDAHSRRASRRPTIAPFSTQRGDGFATGGASLARSIMRDHPDLGLLDTVRLVGGDDVAYEGRIHSTPRSNDPYQTIQPAFVGWMTYAKRRRIQFIYIDRDLGGWGESGNARRVSLPPNYHLAAGGHEVMSAGSAGGLPGLAHKFTRLATNAGFPWAIHESWYYGGGADIGELRYSTLPVAGITGADPNWDTRADLHDLDSYGASWDQGTDHNGAGVNSSVVASKDGRKYANVFTIYKGTFSGDGLWEHHWRDLRVIGRHGLTLRNSGTAADEGYQLGDIVRDLVERFCPKLEWRGNPNSYVVRQAAWRDPVEPYAAIQQMNDMALWNTSVFEDRAFYFYPPDLTEHKWQVRSDDAGARFQLQGDSLEDFANGIEVTYTNLMTGKRELLTPDAYAELRDTSETNPANRWGEELWTSIELPYPTIAGDALQAGRAALAEFNRPKAPGTITIHGHIQDAAGNWQQGWKVREGDTIAITDHPNDAPRLITATTWDPSAKTLQITLDGTSKRLEGLNARIANRRSAANLS